MALPEPHDAPATHDLLCDDYPEAVRTFLAVAAEHATAAYVLLDERELDHDVDDADRCRRVWRDVRSVFDAADALPATDAGQWYRATLPANARPDRREGLDPGERAKPVSRANGDALDRLLGLVDGHVGSHFVHTVALADESDVADGAASREAPWLARAVPHHSAACLTSDDPRLAEAVGDALTPLRACLVETGTEVAWTFEDRRYRVAGGALCRETLDGDRTVCFGLAALRHADRTADRTLRLTWRRPGRPDGRVAGALLRAYERLSPDRPTVLRFPDAATCERAAYALADLLARYEPRAGDDGA